MAARGEDLRRIGDFEALCRYLEDTLGWPLGEGEYDFDALTFPYDPDELGLKDQYADAIESIHQLRPVVDGQPWGIFFVRFKKKKLPVGVLRRILSQFALKQRASANKAERAAWRVDDLLFVSAFGEEAGRNREIAFAHFHQHSGDLPTLRVIGWDGNDTPLKLDYLQQVLANKLHWPADATDAEAWRTLWRSPFRHRPGHVIRKSEELAQELAKLARAIRDRAQAVMKAESTKGPLTKLYDAFKKALIHDLTAEGFADTYAQTITYGLLTAAISRTELSGGRHGTTLLASNLAEMVPVTNPFLKEMLQTFLEAGGRKGGIDFDELGVQDVVELLRGGDTDLPAILLDFGNKTRGEDPVIHFYEHFLKAYNKQLKVQRGVFYTPQPVVSFIVRSVHELLQTEFGLADGLADTTTWGEILKQHPEINLPPLTDTPGEARTISEDEPFVQILDPATGTATFLVEVIEVINKTLTDKWKAQRLTDAQQCDAWNDYVPKHLLPRLHAYELMMAPYAIAHMKIGLKLAETGYRFGTGERARIYLTNALEPWSKQPSLIGFDALAHEAQAVNEVKRNTRFTVVIGNPPYARSSSNKGPFIERLLDSYKIAVRDERNIQPLSDDYIKFIRLSEHLLRLTGRGVHGMITNNTFLSGRIHRGMRERLLSFFSHGTILNLHGSGNVDFLGAQGETDENVFDILQGVSIALLSTSPAKPQLKYAQLIGPRKQKYFDLASSLVPSWGELEPTRPYLLWIPRLSNAVAEFNSFVSLERLFQFYSVSGKPGDDNLLVSIDRDEVLPKLQEFRRAIDNRSLTKLTEAGRNLAARPKTKAFDSSLVCSYAYRPFDTRFTYYDPEIWTRAVRSLRTRIDGSPILLTTKIVKDSSFSHVFVSKLLVDVIFLSNTSSVNCYSFPANCRQDVEVLNFGGSSDRNLDISLLTREIASVSPEDAFGYIYAVLHSPLYRQRYFEFLQYDFPRVPTTGNAELFRVLARIGGELISLHLLEAPQCDQPITEFIGGRNPEVEKISWSDNTVWMDKTQRIGFRGVREDVWNFHIGGYQVCEKWLKDRKGRMLSKQDIAHYHRLIVALSETLGLMSEIDRVIDQHGGWPEAFATVNDSEPETGAVVALPLVPAAARKAAGPGLGGMPVDLFHSAPARKVADDLKEARVESHDTNELCAEVRQYFGDGVERGREETITGLIGSLAYKLSDKNIRQLLDNLLRTCVRRGILQNESGTLSLRYRSLAEYEQDDRDSLKSQFLASLEGRQWVEREEATSALARWMGFKRTGSRIEEVTGSLINGLLREGRLERDGSRIRRT